MNSLRPLGSAALLLLPGLLAASLGGTGAAPKKPASRPAKASVQASPRKAARPAAVTAAKPAPVRTALAPAVALGPPPATVAADNHFAAADLVLDFSSNWHGYLEPCG